MPIPADQLSTFFDTHYDIVRRQWDRQVDRGQMTDWNKQRKELLMDEIGMILRALGEGHAVLTYRPPEERKPAPMIWLPRGNND